MAFRLLFRFDWAMAFRFSIGRWHSAFYLPLLVIRSAKISTYFDHVDFPCPLTRQENIFSPGVDFWVLQGEPFSFGEFICVFPFSRFPTLESIRKRLTVNLVIESLELIQKTVVADCFYINHSNALGCRVVVISERTIETGIFAVVENAWQEEGGAAYGG